MAICEKCIIPDAFPGVTIINGLCSFCRDRLLQADTPGNRLVSKSELLEELLSRPKANESYDCLVPVSGGKDSAYVLYYIVRNLKLKPFAVFFDSGFTNEIARINVVSICTKLGVDWAVIKSPGNFRRRAVVEALYMSKSIGRFFNLCGNCENNLRTMAINEAVSRKIQFIVWGATDYEDAVDSYDAFKRPELFRASFGMKNTLLPAIDFLTGPGFPLLFRSPQHLLKYWYFTVRDNFAMHTPGGLKRLSPLYQVPFNTGSVEVIYFYNYINYDPFRQMNVLRKELGWEAPPGKESRMDCKLHCLSNYSFVTRTGISKDGFNMSNLVRAGIMERSEAFRREEMIRASLAFECAETLRFLGFEEYCLKPVPGWPEGAPVRAPS